MGPKNPILILKAPILQHLVSDLGVQKPSGSDFQILRKGGPKMEPYSTLEGDPRVSRI